MAFLGRTKEKTMSACRNRVTTPASEFGPELDTEHIILHADMELKIWSRREMWIEGCTQGLGAALLSHISVVENEASKPRPSGRASGRQSISNA